MSLSRENAPSQSVSDDVYVGFVRSLFNDPGVLLIGAFCHALVGLLVYYDNRNPIFLVMAALMGFIGAYRSYRLAGVRAEEIKTLAEAHRHERQYLIVGGIQGLILGGFGLSCIYLAPSDFGSIAAVSMLMGSAVTISGRNYGSSKMVLILTLTMFGLPTVGFFLNGDSMDIVLGLLMIPFMIILLKMAASTRVSLFTAITEELRARGLATRFNRALNTMPQGLVMSDANGLVLVANAEAAELMGVASSSRLIGRSLPSLIGRVAAAGLLTLEQRRFAIAQLSFALSEGVDRKVVVDLSDGRHFELTATAGDNNLGVVLFEDVTARVRSDQKIAAMARFDSLTGLPNRFHFCERTAERILWGNPDRQVALAVLDLDDFKAINDSLSHQVGDELIKAISDRLAPLVSEQVAIGRFGGDEFVVYLDAVTDSSIVANLLDDIAARLQQPFEIAENRIRVQISGGAVIATACEADVPGLLVKADLALSRAKSQGKNAWHLYQEEMDDTFRERQRLKADLRLAIENRAISVVFQPIVSMPNLTVVACEALCRWHHPTLGQISPAIFIPLAEEMGIISEITAIVLERSCLECKQWPDDLGVAVNLSAKDFRDPALVSKVEAALALSGLEPARLEVELTESALLDDSEMVVRHVTSIRKLGVRVALDDFGTGYSSLSYLHRLPLSKVKIDRSFLADVLDNPRSLGLLCDVVKLSRRLGLTVTLEGVETFEQLDVISRHVKPDLLQGFLFGAALSSSGIAALTVAKLSAKVPAKRTLSVASASRS